MMNPGSRDMMKSKQEKTSEDGVDRICNLPDHILHLILSHIPTTEEASRTSILSRRWRYLWTSVPSIDIDYSRGLKFPTESQKIKFENFVDWVLLSKSFNLDSFHLCSNHYSMSTSTVTRWAYTAVTRNIKSLHLECCFEDEAEDFAVPNCLVTCGSLEELRLFLFGGRLILPNITGFPALRVLELNNVELFNDNLVESFLKSCPLLEELSLINCVIDELNVLCISCPKLKNLRIHNRNEVDEFEEAWGALKIFCPNLVFLELGVGIADKYFFESLSSLKKAVIHHPEDFLLDLDDKALRELLVGNSHVESLSTSCDICSLIVYQDAGVPISLPNLKTLELTMEFDTDSIDDIIRILSYESWGDLELEEAEMRILTCHLKRVEFLCFTCDGPMPSIARSLFEHANALEEMVFRFKCDKANFHEKSIQTMKGVLWFHKAPPTVKHNKVNDS